MLQKRLNPFAMNDAILSMVWVVIVLGWASYLFFSLTSYQKIRKSSFRFQQQLPFELHDIYLENGQRFQPFQWLIMVITVAMFAYGESVFFYPGIPITYVFLASMVFFLFSMLGIFILQPKRIEVYLFIVTSFLVSATTILFFSSYLAFTSPYGRMQTFFPWTSLLQGIGQCVLLLNPKLSRWAKLEKVEGTNEKPLFRRPQHFVMAYTQWLTLLNMMLWVCLTQVEYLIG
jgi:hypothetical protein